MCGCISSPELGTDDGSISEAEVGVFAFGLGKVYGLAFDEEGNLFATGTDGDKAVIWKINQDGEKVIFAEIKDQGDILSDVGIACHSGHLANLAVDGVGNIWITSLQNGACFVVERDKEYSKIYLNSKLTIFTREDFFYSQGVTWDSNTNKLYLITCGPESEFSSASTHHIKNVTIYPNDTNLAKEVYQIRDSGGNIVKVVRNDGFLIQENGVGLFMRDPALYFIGQNALYEVQADGNLNIVGDELKKYTLWGGTADDRGNIYLSANSKGYDPEDGTKEEGQVLKMDQEGEYSVIIRDIAQPLGMTFRDGYLYIADRSTGNILKVRVGEEITETIISTNTSTNATTHATNIADLTTTSITGTPFEADAAISFKPGDLINYDNLTLTVLGWKLLQEYEEKKPDEGKKFLLVDVLMINYANHFTGIPMNFYLQDKSGQLYNRDFSKTTFASSMGRIYPGERIRNQVLFQVLEDNKDYVFIMDDIPSFEKTADNNNISIILGDDPISTNFPDELLTPYHKYNRVGEITSVDDLEVTVLGWLFSKGDEDVKPDKDKKFLIVDVVIGNNGIYILDSFPAFSISLRDLTGQIYQIDSKYHVEYQYDTLSSDIYPGEQIRTRIVFQVADISSNYLLVFNARRILDFARHNKHDIGYDMNNIIISLGSEPITLDPPDDIFSPGTSVYKIGDVISINNVVLVVLGWEYVSSDQLVKMHRPEDEEMIVLDIMLLNQDTQSITICGSTQTSVKDKSGKKYNDCWGPWDTIERKLYIILVPGERVRSTIYYKVPRHIDDLVFNFDMDNPDNRLYVALGKKPCISEPPIEFLEIPTVLIHSMNKAVEVNDLLIKINDIAFTEESEFGKPAEGNTFMIIDLSITNSGPEIIPFSGSDQMRLKNENDQYYATDFSPVGRVERKEFGTEIAAGQTVHGRVGFQVPKNEHNLIFVFQTLAYRDATIQKEVPQKVFISLSH
jgi:sugar lactone lactonase YvrE